MTDDCRQQVFLPGVCRNVLYNIGVVVDAGERVHVQQKFFANHTNFC